MGRHEKHISGDSFDRQWNESARRGRERAARGEGPWADDKLLSDLRAGGGSQGGGGGDQKGCGKSALLLAASLGGAAWWVADAVSRFA